MLKKTKIVFGPSFPNLIPTKKKVKPSKFSEKEEKLREEEHWKSKEKKTFSIFGCNHVYSSHTIHIASCYYTIIDYYDSSLI